MENKLAKMKCSSYDEDLKKLKKRVKDLAKMSKSEKDTPSVEYLYESSSEQCTDNGPRCEPEEDCDYS